TAYGLYNNGASLLRAINQGPWPDLCLRGLKLTNRCSSFRMITVSTPWSAINCPLLKHQLRLLFFGRTTRQGYDDLHGTGCMVSHCFAGTAGALRLGRQTSIGAENNFIGPPLGSRFDYLILDVPFSDFKVHDA